MITLLFNSILTYGIYLDSINSQYKINTIEKSTGYRQEHQARKTRNQEYLVLSRYLLILILMTYDRYAFTYISKLNST